MAKDNFNVEILSFKEVHEIPDDWSDEALRGVLEAADYDDPVDAADLNDMVSMVLQDLGSREAAELVLEQVFGANMSAGVRQNLAADLEDERPWEQFTDIGKQAGVYRACVLLHRAFPNSYATPDAVRLEISVRANSKDTSAWLRGLSPSLLVRLLAAGMPDDAVLTRLYEEELAGDEFPAAPDVLWRVDVLEKPGAEDPAQARLSIYSSHQWLYPLEEVESYQARAWPDGER